MWPYVVLLLTICHFLWPLLPPPYNYLWKIYVINLNSFSIPTHAFAAFPCLHSHPYIPMFPHRISIAVATPPLPSDCIIISLLLCYCTDHKPRPLRMSFPPKSGYIKGAFLSGEITINSTHWPPQFVFVAGSRIIIFIIIQLFLRLLWGPLVRSRSRSVANIETVLHGRRQGVWPRPSILFRNFNFGTGLAELRFL